MNVSKHFRRLIMAAVLVQLNIQSAHADAQGDMIRGLLAKHESGLVTLRLIVKASMGGEEAQSEIEADGLLMNASGLVVTTNMAIDPSAAYSDAMGDAGRSISSKVVSLKILMNGGIEIPAKVVLRDKNRNLAFIRPIRKPAMTLRPFNFAEGGPARTGDVVYILGRMGKAGNRSAEAKLNRITSTITRPRRVYVLDPYTYIYSGHAVFNERGQLLGLLLPRISRGGRTTSRVSDSFLSIVIPASDINEAAQQAPQNERTEASQTRTSSGAPSRPLRTRPPGPKTKAPRASKP